MSNSGRVRWRTLRRSIQAVGAALCLAMLCAKVAPAAEREQAPPRDLSPDALAARIDQALAAGWKAEGVVPAPPADDAEFLRRASLDILGKIPAASEVRAFLRDQTPNKRRRLIYGLLARGGFANHFANTWRELLLPGANTNAQTRALAPPLEAWLRLRFAENAPYDRLVSELLTPAALPGAQPGAAPAAASAPSPLAFFQVNEYKPENLAANTSRLFLGTQVQCAQCHDHPFARWKREEFWSLAAFFSGSSVVAQSRALPSMTPRPTTPLRRSPLGPKWSIAPTASWPSTFPTRI